MRNGKRAVCLTGYRDYLVASLFVLFWLLPMAYRGLANRELFPALPTSITFLHNVACLFTHPMTQWSVYHVQGTADGQAWFTLRDDRFSPMKPFGHCARVDRMIGRFTSFPQMAKGELQKKELALWYQQRYSELNPDKPRLRAIRIVFQSYSVGGRLAAPVGHWTKHAPEEVPEQGYWVTYEMAFE